MAVMPLIDSGCGGVPGGISPWTSPSGPAATRDSTTVFFSPSCSWTGASAENVFTLARSMVISPAASVFKMSLPPVALTILPVSRSPFR